MLEIQNIQIVILLCFYKQYASQCVPFQVMPIWFLRQRNMTVSNSVEVYSSKFKAAADREQRALSHFFFSLTQIQLLALREFCLLFLCILLDDTKCLRQPAKSLTNANQGRKDWTRQATSYIYHPNAFRLTTEFVLLCFPMPSAFC